MAISLASMLTNVFDHLIPTNDVAGDPCMSWIDGPFGGIRWVHLTSRGLKPWKTTIFYRDTKIDSRVMPYMLITPK